jgi:hypothetical protein
VGEIPFPEYRTPRKTMPSGIRYTCLLKNIAMQFINLAGSILPGNPQYFIVTKKYQTHPSLVV